MLTSLLLLILIIGVGVVIFLLLNSRNQAENKVLLEWLKTSQRDLKSLERIVSESQSRNSQEISESLRRQTQDIHERLTKASEVIGELKREAGAFSEVSRSMKDLQEYLKSPKLRGNIGEEVLSDLIAQMFPKKQYHLQYAFKSGRKVDAAIRTDNGILPIDAKFPLENFQLMLKGEAAREREAARKDFIKDVKKHIEDISDKYILPEEGTMDFALMYIPSEAILYEIINESALMDYAREKRVFPVSPSSLYYHLQMILLSFEGKKIESRSKELFSLLRQIQGDYGKVEKQFDLLGKHLTNAYNAFGSTSSMFSALKGRLEVGKNLEAKEPPLLK